MKIKSLLSHFLLLSVSLTCLAFTTGCLSNYAVKNKALVLSVEKFDNAVIAHSKSLYPDPEQQKVFSDFIKKNSEIDVRNVEIKDDDATADLEIKTPKESVYAELKGVSGREWKSKIDSNMEVRKFKLTLKNLKKSWEITDQQSVSTN